MQQNIVANAAGLLKPGYNRQKIHLGQTTGNQSAAPQIPTRASGGQNGNAAGGDSLAVIGYSLTFEQGTIDPAGSPTSLAIRGEGFFMVAENAQPGARVFLTRAGDFSFDAAGRLVNAQGLFVVGGNGQTPIDAEGRLLSSVPFVTRLPDGTVDLTQVSLGKVPSSGQLSVSGYGDTIYQPNGSSGPIKIFPNGRPEVGFVQASSIEIPNRIGAAGILAAETTTAVQTYKIFKDMLTEFNKSVDDSINLVK